MMLPQTERYLDLAQQGRNAWWRYALGAATIAFFWLVLGYAPYLLLVGAGVSDQMLEYLAVNFSIFMMLAGLVLTVKLIHGRPLLSLVTPEARVDWRRVGHSALVWAVIAAVIVVIENLLYPDRYYLSFDPGRFFVFLAIVLVLTPIQTTAEELVFRGYAMQGLGLLTRRPALIAVASSLIFTAPHLLNPEVHVHGVLIMAANYFVIGMLLATDHAARRAARARRGGACGEQRVSRARRQLRGLGADDRIDLHCARARSGLFSRDDDCRDARLSLVDVPAWAAGEELNRQARQGATKTIIEPPRRREKQEQQLNRRDAERNNNN